jgi:translation initiation factor 6 (eIF-6)
MYIWTLFLFVNMSTYENQQIHSFLASGVISSHVARAATVETRAFCKSKGILCATPFDNSFFAIIVN